MSRAKASKPDTQQPLFGAAEPVAPQEPLTKLSHGLPENFAAIAQAKTIGDLEAIYSALKGPDLERAGYDRAIRNRALVVLARDKWYTGKLAPSERLKEYAERGALPTAPFVRDEPERTAIVDEAPAPAPAPAPKPKRRKAKS